MRVTPLQFDMPTPRNFPGRLDLITIDHDSHPIEAIIDNRLQSRIYTHKIAAVLQF